MKTFIQILHGPGKYIALALVMLGGLVFFSCSNETVPAAVEENIALPPSLTGQKAAPKHQLVKLGEQQAQELNIQTVIVQKDNFSYPVAVPGVVLPAPDRISVISAPINGLVIALHAHEGENVRKGEALLELESLEFANLVADYLQAMAEETYQKSQLERMQVLVEKKIRSRRDLEKAQTDRSRANVATRAAYARLLAVGVTEAQIDSWQTGNEKHAHLKILSPIDGVITEHLIDMGQAVTAYQQMATVVNTDKVLIKGFVAPEDGSILKPGDRVAISLREFPQRMLEAQIHTIVPTLDEVNKSITVNVLVNTPQHWPRPGQNVQLNIFAQIPEAVLTVPLTAVEYEGEQAAVFVKQDEFIYEKRFIDVRKITGQSVIVESGLQGGEEVAVSQVFSLKALGKYGEFAEE